MSTERRTRLEVALEPALAAYGAELERHGVITDHTDGNARNACRCGWAPRSSVRARNTSRAIGIHAAAARKRADITYNAAAALAIAELDRPTTHNPNGS